MTFCCKNRKSGDPKEQEENTPEQTEFQYAKNPLNPESSTIDMEYYRPPAGSIVNQNPPSGPGLQRAASNHPRSGKIKRGIVNDFMNMGGQVPRVNQRVNLLEEIQKGTDTVLGRLGRRLGGRMVGVLVLGLVDKVA